MERLLLFPTAMPTVEKHTHTHTRCPALLGPGAGVVPMEAPMAAASGPRVLYVPCMEDETTCARHPNAAQDVLCNVSRALLTQVQRSAAVASKRQTAGSAESAGAAANTEAVWRESYEVLWERRNSVPEGLRREWLETAATCMTRLSSVPGDRAQDALLSFDWLFNVPLFFRPEGHSAVHRTAPTGKAEQQGQTPQPPVEGQASPPPGKGGKRKRQRRWVLWEDPSRGQVGIHHLTIPTAVRGAFRPLDVTRLEGTAFPARVRAWLGASTAPTSAERESASAAPAVLPMTPPPAARENADDKSLYSLLATLRGEQQQQEAEPGSVAARQLRGAVRFRMVLEVVWRLQQKPRCLPTWRLLAEALSFLLSAAALGGGRCPEATAAARALVKSFCDYTLRFIVPFLEMRERFAAVMQNPLTCALREELLRVAGGQGVWSTTLPEAMPELVAAWGGLSAPDRVGACYQALLDVCDFVDEPPLTASTGALDHTAVLSYFKDSNSSCGNAKGENEEGPDRLFESPVTRRKCLSAFIAKHFLLSPLESFGRGAVEHSGQPSEGGLG